MVQKQSKNFGLAYAYNIMIKDARLGRGLVFEDEFATQQRMRIRRLFGSGRDS